MWWPRVGTTRRTGAWDRVLLPLRAVGCTGWGADGRADALWCFMCEVLAHGLGGSALLCCACACKPVATAPVPRRCTLPPHLNQDRPADTQHTSRVWDRCAQQPDRPMARLAAMWPRALRVARHFAFATPPAAAALSTAADASSSTSHTVGTSGNRGGPGSTSAAAGLSPDVVSAAFERAITPDVAEHLQGKVGERPHTHRSGTAQQEHSCLLRKGHSCHTTRLPRLRRWQGWAVVDGVFGPELSSRLRDEVLALHRHGHMRLNNTHLVRPPQRVPVACGPRGTPLPVPPQLPARRDSTTHPPWR